VKQWKNQNSGTEYWLKRDTLPDPSIKKLQEKIYWLYNNDVYSAYRFVKRICYSKKRVFKNGWLDRKNPEIITIPELEQSIFREKMDGLFKLHSSPLSIATIEN
jgi:hypothetical protein